MRRVNVKLDTATINASKALCAKYGDAASLSALVRRAIALLSERWEELDRMPRARAEEVAEFGKYLAVAQRGRAASMRPAEKVAE